MLRQFRLDTPETLHQFDPNILPGKEGKDSKFRAYNLKGNLRIRKAEFFGMFLYFCGIRIINSMKNRMEGLACLDGIFQSNS